MKKLNKAIYNNLIAFGGFLVCTARFANNQILVFQLNLCGKINTLHLAVTLAPSFRHNHAFSSVVKPRIYFNF